MEPGGSPPPPDAVSRPAPERPAGQWIQIVDDIQKLEPKRPVRIQWLRHAFQLFFLYFMTFTVAGHMLQPFVPILPMVLPQADWMPAGVERPIVTQYSVAARALAGVWPLGWAIMPVAAVLLLGSVFGRLMCGWACPIGALQDFLTGISRRLGLKRWEPPTRLHRALLVVKYFTLALTLLFAATLGLAGAVGGPETQAGYQDVLAQGLICDSAYVEGHRHMCQVPLKLLSFEGNLYVFLVGATKGVPVWKVMMVTQFALFLVVLGAMLVTPRFYCRYMCRTGALISLTNKWSLLQIRKDHATCDGNNNCLDVCPMGKGQNHYRKGEEPWLETMNCVHADRCVEACPTPTLSIRFITKDLWTSAWWRRARKPGRPRGKDGEVALSSTLVVVGLALIFGVALYGAAAAGAPVDGEMGGMDGMGGMGGLSAAPVSAAGLLAALGLALCLVGGALRLRAAPDRPPSGAAAKAGRRPRAHRSLLRPSGALK